MKVHDLIEELKKLPPNDVIFPQVTAEDGSAWNMWLEINKIPDSDLVQLRLYHPELKTLTQTQQGSQWRKSESEQ